MTFAEHKDWLAKFPDQQDGLPCSVCETGEPYVEFRATALARPGDAATIEGLVADQMKNQLGEYLNGRRGRIYWRIRLETDIDDYPMVARYDDNGPDKDFMTDRRCHLDKNWKRVAAYCRVYRATLLAPSEEALMRREDSAA